MNRPLRIALLAVLAVIVVVAGAGAVLIARFDPDSYKPDIILAVKHATGRDLTLNGKISLKPSLWPTIEVEDVAFSNTPGFSRPQMATLRGMEVQLGLLPLLSSRIELDRLTLIHPDILLETNAGGVPNWRMAPEVSPSAPSGSQASVKSGHATTAISIDAVRIVDGTLAYRNDSTGKVTTVGLSKLDVSAASPDAPLHLVADAVYQGTAFNLVADTGSLTRLQDPAARSAWPVSATLTAAGAKLVADGTMTRPLLGSGYDLAVSGTVPDAAALAPLLPGFNPPPLHDVRFAAKIVDSGGRLPDFSTLTLHVGASDLGAEVAGLSLEKLDIEAPTADRPVKIDASGRFGDAPLVVAGVFGAPALLMPGAAPAPFPVDVTVQAAGASVSAKGSVANAASMTGLSVALSARIPDLSALSPLVRRALPALKDVAFQANLTDADGGFGHGAALRGISLTSAEGDVSGDAAAGFGVRPSLTATLKSSQVDLDALQAAIEAVPAGGSAAPAGGAATQPAAASPRRRDERLFSDRPIPFDLLRAADADISVDIADVRSGGRDYKSIATHAMISNGKLVVEPFAADLPAGRMSGTLSVDATQAPPSVHLVLHAPGLAVQTVLAGFHQPPYATGDMEVEADLSGAGDSPHAIAASLYGSLGLAMTGGTIDNRLLGSLLGKVMESLNALNLVGRGGSSEVRCLALRMDARHGVGAIKPLALNSSLLTMTGVGTVNLGAETVAMALRPTARIAGTGLVIPIAVTGPIRDPSVKVNDLGAAEANAGTIAGVVIGDATPLGIIGGLFGVDKLFGGPADVCGPALAMARGQPVPEAASGKSAQPGASNPAAFLKNLFR